MRGSARPRLRQPPAFGRPAKLTEGADSRGVRRSARRSRTGHRGGEGKALGGPAGKGEAVRVRVAGVYRGSVRARTSWHSGASEYMTDTLRHGQTWSEG